MQTTVTKKNPILWMDIPDVDVIRVGDTYYMVSTTMHSMPGGVILRSYDLLNWEVATYLYDELDGTPAQRLEDGRGMYSSGMWAASLRYHKGVYHCFFVAKDTHQSYHYSAEKIEGPWKKQIIPGYYHDCSVLFDDDGRIYIIYGNGLIRMTELTEDFTVKEGGVNKVIIEEKENVTLKYEGSHFYKINGKYYVFLIHWFKEGSRRRAEACFVSDRADGPYTGGNILDDDMGYHNAGVAQGGIVDTPDGQWYGMLFQDHGAVGRIPVLVPMHWENDFPVFGIDGKVPHVMTTVTSRPGYSYFPLVSSDDFDYEPGEKLKSFWQWNHIPDARYYSLTARRGWLRLTTGHVVTNFVQAKNTLTQRTQGPVCEGEVTLDASRINDGDYAGLGVIQSHYGIIAVTRDAGQKYLVMLGRSERRLGEDGRPQRWDDEPGIEYGRVPLTGGDVVELKVRCNFAENIDEADFYYKLDGAWIPLGIRLKMLYTLDHFMGYRFSLFNFATKRMGGYADFDCFRFRVIEE